MRNRELDPDQMAKLWQLYWDIVRDAAEALPRGQRDESASSPVEPLPTEGIA